MKSNLKILLLLGFGCEIAYLAITLLGNLRLSIPLFLVFYGVAFLLYCIATKAFFLPEIRPGSGTLERSLQQDPQNKLIARKILIIGIFCGIFFRLTLLFSMPSLSDDIYRYIWDGKVNATGINPYRYAPEDEALSGLRDESVYPKINHKEIPTVYPPVSQLIFQGLYFFSPKVLGFKFGFLIFDLFTAGALFIILRELKLDPRRLLIYFWNPLIIIEVSGSAHADIIGVFFLFLALYFLIRKKAIQAAAILVLSFLTKFIAVFFLPVITFLKRKNKFLIPLVFLVGVSILYLPHMDVGGRLFSGLAIYADKWKFNGSAFNLITQIVQHLLPQEWIIEKMITPYGMSPTPETLMTRGLDMALLISKRIIVVCFGSVMVWIIFRLNRNTEAYGKRWLFTAGLILFGAFVVLNSTVHPWYLCWIIPFLVIHPNRAWLLLSGLTMLSYWTLIQYTETGIWEESSAVKLVEYVPFYALLSFDYLKKHDAALGKLKSKFRQWWQ